jgi:cbb3-type cytochrome oxidase maturation protein
MSVIIILILASLAVAVLFLSGFIWAVRNGQYEDTLTPSMRVLAEDDFTKTAAKAVPVTALKPIDERHKS